ncbi:MAG: ATP-binding protein [Oceanicoccus sp.]
MKWLSWFGGIRSRLLVISILPVVVAAVALSWFSLVAQNESLSRAFFQSGDSTAAYIAATAELSMYAADRATLRRLGTSGLRTPAVVSIGFIDRDNGLLVAVGDGGVIGPGSIDPCIENGNWEKGLYWFFCKPVLESEQLFSDFDLDDDGNKRVSPNRYGWVVLAVSREGMLRQQQMNIQVLFAVAFFIVLAAALLAFRISRSISAPVLSLEKTVNELDSGVFSSRAQMVGPSETRALARGINRLAGSVAHSQKQLASKVDDATSRLVTAMETLSSKNSDLEKTQQELQLAMTAKDHFLAKMSHELRTPLTAVVGFSRLLNQSKLDDKQVEYSNNIAAASELLLDTIDDILDFSKLQSDALSIEAIDFDLREIMEGLIAMHVYQAESKALDLVLTIDRNIPSSLSGDPTRIKQIVNNLLSNAVKFTEEGEVLLQISLVQKNSNTLFLSIDVRDSGIGIDERSQAGLFKPFTQADDTITRRFGGTGLGLVICKQLAELMGGSIAIESHLGVGTCMTVKLPLLANELVPTAPPRHNKLVSIVQHIDGERMHDNSSAREINVSPLTGLNILLAEDNYYNRQLIQTVVERSGASVWTVANGAEAVDVFRRQQFDVVLMDVHMPLMDGISATKKIVELAGDKGIPIFGLTANVVEAEHEALLAAGATGIFGKPLDEIALVKAIFECIGRSHQSYFSPKTPPLETLVSMQSLQAELDGLFSKINNEIKQGKFDQANDTLHEMRGLSGMFKLVSLSELIGGLSLVIMTADKEELSGLLVNIETCINELR